MIVLDTNVISEIMANDRDPLVVSWLDAQRADDVWTTAVNVFEVRYGLAKMSQGRKRQALSEAFERMLQHALPGRVLAFNEETAGQAATIMSTLRALGRPIDIRDALIAGTVAAQQGAILATRNTKHFADAGIPLVDPWAFEPG